MKSHTPTLRFSTVCFNRVPGRDDRRIFVARRRFHLRRTPAGQVDDCSGVSGIERGDRQSQSTVVLPVRLLSDQ